MPGFDALVFDLDGTLVDTLEDLGASMNAALAEFGLPQWPMADYRFMVGNGMRKLTERAVGEKADPERIEALLQRFLQIYDRDCLVCSRPYEGMQETVAALRRQGLCLLVVTNKAEAQAVKIVTQLFPGMFEGIYGNMPGRPTKPDPCFTLEVLTQRNIKPGRALFIGDSNVDIETAYAAGMRSAGAIWGFRGEKELRAAGADFLMAHPADLLEIVENNG